MHGDEILYAWKKLRYSCEILYSLFHYSSHWVAEFTGREFTGWHLFILVVIGALWLMRCQPKLSSKCQYIKSSEWAVFFMRLRDCCATLLEYVAYGRAQGTIHRAGTRLHSALHYVLQ